MAQNPNSQNEKPNVDNVKKLIMDAPIGSYIGEEGAQIFAARACSEIQLKDNEFLFRKDETTTSFYLVSSGRLARIKERKSGKKPRILHTLHKGDLVGELSFIDQTHHARSVIALGDASVLQFKSEDITPLITEHPRLVFDFMRAVIRRVHHTVTDISRQQMALSEYIGSGGKGRQ